MDRRCVLDWITLWSTEGCARPHVLAWAAEAKSVDMHPRLFRALIPRLFTYFPHVLHIQLIPDFCHLLPDHHVELNSFFNFLNRVDSGSVVFSPQFAGNFREAEMELASK